MPVLQCAVLGWLLALAAPALAGPGRVFLVGMDGASWNVIDPLLARGELPHFAALATRGRTAELETVEPVSSPVVWTSIATGRSPEAHGVTDFYATRLRMAVPSVFERMARASLRVGLYDWLVAWPPQAFPGGFVIPGWLRRDPSVTPSDVWQRAGLAPFVVEYADLKTNDEYLAMSRRELALKATRWNALVRAFALDVGAVVFYSADMRSHRFWRAAHPEEFEDELPPPPAGQRGLVDEAYLGLDAALGEIAATLAPEDMLLVASDHGFRAREEGARPVWVTRLAGPLARAGLDPGRDGFSVISEFFAASIRVHPGPTEGFAGRDALAARLTGLLESFRSEDDRPLFSVYALDVAARPPGFERPLLKRVYQWGVRQALWLLFDTRVDPTAHTLVIALPEADTVESLWPDARVRVDGSEARIGELLSRQEFSGGHDPIGVFLAAGGPIAPSPVRGRLSVLEIAPLLLYLAGQPLPDDLESGLPEAWIDPALLASRPPRRVPAAALPGFEAQGGGPPAVPEELTETLRALGYVE